MKPKLFRILQFTASLLVLMEGVRHMDTDFYFPWLYFITGLLMMAIVPLIPALNSRYYLSGAIIYLAETAILSFIGYHYLINMKKYGALLYLAVAFFLLISGIRNLRKV